ncbi:MAG: DNA-3-methyladenine glycosylase I [Paracoccaceae bacterium]|nr:DNA-3-methyladenine glycosylase I [Paracoccaceae bacterium]
MKRCLWPGKDQIYIDYHDNEWGFPEYNSIALFEKLILDGFQAGLSWITILKKRENFRKAFYGFDPEQLSKWGTSEVELLLRHPGIIRHRGKIEATINNAKVFLKIEECEGFNNFLWKYVSGKPLINRWTDNSEIPAYSELSVQISSDLKQLGFKFCGPTIVYAFLQATGIINDHLITCPSFKICQKYSRQHPFIKN